MARIAFGAGFLVLAVFVVSAIAAPTRPPTPAGIIEDIWARLVDVQTNILPPIGSTVKKLESDIAAVQGNVTGVSKMVFLHQETRHVFSVDLGGAGEMRIHAGPDRYSLICKTDQECRYNADRVCNLAVGSPNTTDIYANVFAVVPGPAAGESKVSSVICWDRTALSR